MNPGQRNRNVNCAEATDYLSSFLKSSDHSLPSLIRKHISSCPNCLAFYNTIKWRLSKDSIDLLELKEFLGTDFQTYVDASLGLAEDWAASPRDSCDAVESFYRTTKWYAYNLALWKASGRRPEYVRAMHPILSSLGIRSIFDFGAGVGNDSLEFAELGYDVTAVDFENLSTNFLRYRLDRRGLRNVTFINVDNATPSLCRGRCLWCMDVVEHLIDPVDTLTPYLREANAFAYGSEHTGRSGGRQDFHFQHRPSDLLAACETMGFVRQHLAASEPTVTFFARPNRG